MKTLLTSDISNTDEPKFCRNCKHLIGVRSIPNSSDQWKCGHESNFNHLDLVTGNKIYKLACHFMRLPGDDTICGPEGVFFELYVAPIYHQPLEQVKSAKIQVSNIATDNFQATDLNTFASAAAAKVEAMKNKKKGIKLSDLDLENL